MLSGDRDPALVRVALRLLLDHPDRLDEVVDVTVQGALDLPPQNPEERAKWINEMLSDLKEQLVEGLFVISGQETAETERQRIHVSKDAEIQAEIQAFFKDLGARHGITIAGFRL